MAVHEEFIEILEGLLKDKALSQKELAEKIGLRRPSISDWKKKGTYPYADVAVKIAEILGVSVEYLITGKNAEGITREEGELLAAFRLLDSRDQEDVLGIIQGKIERAKKGDILSNLSAADA